MDLKTEGLSKLDWQWLFSFVPMACQDNPEIFYSESQVFEKYDRLYWYWLAFCKGDII